MLVKDPQEIRKILEETKTIAVVGFSDDPEEEPLIMCQNTCTKRVTGSFRSIPA